MQPSTWEGPALLAAALALALFASPLSASARSFDYLHIDADSGASSGGHAAIRFGDETYHFVYAQPGILEAARDPSETFDYVYRAYDNRGINVARVEVPDPAYAALRQAFLRRHVVENAQLEALDSARRDRVFLAALAGSDTGDRLRDLGDDAVVLKGAGYFFGPPTAHSKDANAKAAREATGFTPETLERAGVGILRRLRASIADELGRDFLARKRAETAREIRALAYTCASVPRLERGRVPDPGSQFATRYRDLLLIALALEVLETARPPVSGSFRASSARGFALNDEAIATLEKRSSRARRDVLRLVTSERVDRGFPLLVGLARLVALEASIASRQLIVLDTFANDRDTVSPLHILENDEAAAAVLREKHREVRGAWTSFVRANAGDELSWSALEAAANVYFELERGLATGAPIRVDTSPVPARPAALEAAWPRPAHEPSTLAEWASCARATEESLREEIVRLYAYDLVSRNCVTEIFATIDDAFANTPHDDGMPAVAAQIQALGGHVDPDRGFNFVPFVSAQAVGRTYRVTERLRLASYRHYWLDRMLRGPRPLRTRLRESNTLTSNLYQSGASDVFLFFTDDTPVLRPLLGVTNVAYAAGAAAAGTAILPFDRGALVRRGLRGILYSLPELAFLNIRKGSNTIVPRNWTAAPPVSGAADNVQ